MPPRPERPTALRAGRSASGHGWGPRTGWGGSHGLPPGWNEYAYSGARAALRRSMDLMLWSDPHDEPPKEMRATLAMLRRLCWLLPVTVVVAAVLVNIR